MVMNDGAHEVGDLISVTPEEASRLLAHGVIESDEDLTECMAVSGGETAMITRRRRGRPRKTEVEPVHGS